MLQHLLAVTSVKGKASMYLTMFRVQGGGKVVVLASK